MGPERTAIKVVKLGADGMCALEIRREIGFPRSAWNTLDTEQFPDFKESGRGSRRRRGGVLAHHRAQGCDARHWVLRDDVHLPHEEQVAEDLRDRQDHQITGANDGPVVTELRAPDLANIPDAPRPPCSEFESFPRKPGARGRRHPLRRGTNMPVAPSATQDELAAPARTIEQLASRPTFASRWERKLAYSQSITDFVSDCVWIAEPRNANADEPVKLPVVLFPRQQAFLEWLVERFNTRTSAPVEKSRDSGATWMSLRVRDVALVVLSGLDGRLRLEEGDPRRPRRRHAVDLREDPQHRRAPARVHEASGVQRAQRQQLHAAAQPRKWRLRDRRER